MRTVRAPAKRSVQRSSPVELLVAILLVTVMAGTPLTGSAMAGSGSRASEVATLDWRSSGWDLVDRHVAP